MKPVAVAVASCVRCGKRQPVVEMSDTYFGVWVCFDKTQCQGRNMQRRE